MKLDIIRHIRHTWSLNIEAGFPDAASVGDAWNMDMYERSVLIWDYFSVHSVGVKA